MARVLENQAARLDGPINAALSQEQFMLGLEETEFEAARSRVASEDFHFFPKNHVTPRNKSTLFMPRLGR